ncbi:hypothetical protein AB0M41_29605 [Streptomyces sp. NPDC051896]|uniref:hypothetical protein n=1 Tax=Streptomyces sp. NPDC051896 TaxID=3155416 RepID=UPI0034295679
MEEPPFAVVLTGVGDHRTDVVRVLRIVTGLSAWHSARLRAAGAEADVVCGSCTRTIPLDGRPVDPGPCAARAWFASDCPASRS